MLFHKDNHQDVCILSPANQARDASLIAGTIHISNFDTVEAWGLDAKQQCIDEKSGRYVQFISSLSCDPIQIYETNPSEPADLCLLSSQTEDQEMTYTDYGKQKDSRLLWIGISLGMLTLTVCLVVLLKVAG